MDKRKNLEREITHLSLFSGIGGIDLAAEWAGIKTVGQCEWAEYPTKVLEKHWPTVPRWKDIRTLTGKSFYEKTNRRTVDIISGGFPCQPFSVAGKRRGKEDDRYLWPEMVRVIKELRPTWVVGENVAGIVRMALPDILSELEACGYRTRTFLIPACAVGARHRRYRVAIVGYSEHNGLSATAVSGSTQKTSEREPKGKKEAGELAGTGKPGNSKAMANAESQYKRRLPVRTKKEKPGFGSGGEDVQHAYSAECKEQHTTSEPEKTRIAMWGCDAGDVCNASGKGLQDGAGKSVEGQEQEPESERSMRRATKSILGRMVDGISAWLDGDLDFIIGHHWDDEPNVPRTATGVEHRAERIKCLGNAVVPQQFYPIFRAIAETEKGENKREKNERGKIPDL